MLDIFVADNILCDNRLALRLAIINQCDIRDKGCSHSHSRAIDALVQFWERPPVKVTVVRPMIGPDTVVFENSKNTHRDGPEEHKGGDTEDCNPLDMETEKVPNLVTKRLVHAHMVEPYKPADNATGVLGHPERGDEALAEVAADSEAVEEPSEELLDDDGDGGIAGEGLGQGPEIDTLVGGFVHGCGEAKVEAEVKNHGANGVHENEVEDMSGRYRVGGGLGAGHFESVVEWRVGE